jgi:hypothetical protein
LRIDEVGYWSEVKLDIIEDYAKEYSKILAAQKKPQLQHVYIDAFAGAGVHKRKGTGEEVAGSPPSGRRHRAAVPGVSSDRLGRQPSRSLAGDVP